jgi:predicted TIM-barrel fold metal-dependent hydrolase
MIIDCHCHAGRGDQLTQPWNTHAPLSAYLRRARAAGIERTVVLPPGHSDYAAANAELAAIVRRHHGRLVGFGGLHAARDAGRIPELVRQCVEEHGFCGMKVHAYDAPPTREVCEAARRWQIPLLVDVVGRAYLVDLFAPQYPDVNFIIPHIGSFMDDWRAQQRVVDQLMRYPNVYADTAGVRRFDYLLQAVRRAGAHKLIFGSDGPWLHPAVELYKIRMLKLPPAQEQAILGGNLRRILPSRRLAARPLPTQVPSRRHHP